MVYGSAPSLQQKPGLSRMFSNEYKKATHSTVPTIVCSGNFFIRVKNVCAYEVALWE